MSHTLKSRIAALAGSLLATATLSLAGAPMAQVADAAAATSISGAIIKGNSTTRASNAGVRLYRWQNARAVFVTRTQADANGHYAFTGLADGYNYLVDGYKTYGSCNSLLESWEGYSSWRFATGVPLGANVRIFFQYYVSCFLRDGDRTADELDPTVPGPEVAG